MKTNGNPFPIPVRNRYSCAKCPVYCCSYPEIEITPAGQDDPLLTGLAPRQHIFQWHEDTFDVPKGAVHLMQGNLCRNQSFRYGRTAYAFQCHFEVSEELARTWLDNWGHTIAKYYDPPRVEAELKRENADYQSWMIAIGYEIETRAAQRAGLSWLLSRVGVATETAPERRRRAGGA